MASYVLVPGGGWGGIVWSQVAWILRSASHEVFTPSLTGLGERAHLLSRDINLETHVKDVVGVLDYYHLTRAILVGHSYGGMVITGAADCSAVRVSHLVYVDAHAPQDGESAIDLAGPALAQETMELAEKEGDGWLLTPPADAPPFMTPHPLKTCTQRLRLKNPDAMALLPKTYVYCTHPALPAIFKSAERARAGGWRYHELPTGHMAMLTMPKEVAEILLALGKS